MGLRRKQKSKWLLPLVYSLSVLLLVAAAAFYLRTEKDFFIIRDVPVQVEFHPAQQALVESHKSQLQKDFAELRGQNIWQSDLKSFRQNLLSKPWVKELQLQRRFPQTVAAKVFFKKPLLVFVDKKNRFHPIVEGGEKLAAMPAVLSPLVPLLRNNKIVQDATRLNHLLSLWEEVPRLGALQAANVAQVDYAQPTGLTLHLIEPDVLVHMGESEIQTKGLQIIRVLDYLKSQKQKARVIDGSFKKKVLVRLRKRS